MELSQLERYAPKARVDFIQAVTARASKLGISKSDVLEAKKSGDALIIGGNAFPANIDHKRQALVDRVEKDGFDKVMEEAAYTWFNRFTAMRYMEIHGYIEEHPFSLFEGSDGSSEPEILKNVTDLNDWKELNFNLALDLKTQNKTEDLYRLILTAQCDSLGKIIPFLFSYHAAEIELLLPDGLLLSDSIIKEMISVLNEESLGEVESLGWLYQFYISEKKDTLMKAKKAYKTDEIPAVTQLFTPNWIVQYLTQNSIGRLWLSVYPSSPLKDKMEYYIEPAEQTDEVNKQLADITPDSLNPEEVTVLDPACGSGHILVEAYNLLKEIYLERGYQEKEIPRLILKNNLFGLDIDDRAAQLARFVLLMRARQDDRRLFRLKDEIKLNVHAIQETNGFNLSDFKALGIDGVEELIATFQDAKTFGSLIEIPDSLKRKLELVSSSVLDVSREYSFDSVYVKQLIPLANQALLMGQKYNVVVANPPYLGRKFYNPALKSFIGENFRQAKGDLYTCFIIRNMQYTKLSGFVGMITIPNWMFLSSFEGVRNEILKSYCIDSLIHNGRGVWGSDFGSCSFVFRKSIMNSFKGRYKRLFEKQGSVVSNLELVKRFFSFPDYHASGSDFKKIPGSPIAYWTSKSIREIFEKAVPLGSIASPRAGLATGDNTVYQRQWFEVAICNIAFDCETNEESKKRIEKWYPCNSGGNFRKWYGNNEVVVNWQKDGEEVRNFRDENGKLRSRPQNTQYFFKEGITWTKLSSSNFAARFRDKGFVFDDTGRSAFLNNPKYSKPLLAYLCSILSKTFLSILNPSMSFTSGDISNLPIIEENLSVDEKLYKKIVRLSKSDWDSYETSWDFKFFPLLKTNLKNDLLKDSYNNWRSCCVSITKEIQHLDVENNRSFISAYGLQDEIEPEVLEEQITLTGNPKYRYSGSNLSEEELWQRFQFDTIKELISYSVGCETLHAI
jgi:hypothetical protein